MALAKDVQRLAAVPLGIALFWLGSVLWSEPREGKFILREVDGGFEARPVDPVALMQVIDNPALHSVFDGTSPQESASDIGLATAFDGLGRNETCSWSFRLERR